MTKIFAILVAKGVPEPRVRAPSATNLAKNTLKSIYEGDKAHNKLRDKLVANGDIALR